MTPPHPPTLLPQLSITPIQAELLAEEYVCEEAAYRQGASDIFSLLRARLRSDPVLTQRCFDACDDDKDGRIVGKQVCVLCALECVVRAVCIGMRMQPVMTTDDSGFMGKQVHAMCGRWMCGWIGSVRPLQGRAAAPYHCCVPEIYIPPRAPILPARDGLYASRYLLPSHTFPSTSRWGSWPSWHWTLPPLLACPRRAPNLLVPPHYPLGCPP